MDELKTGHDGGCTCGCYCPGYEDAKAKAAEGCFVGCYPAVIQGDVSVALISVPWPADCIHLALHADDRVRALFHVGAMVEAHSTVSALKG